MIAFKRALALDKNCVEALIARNMLERELKKNSSLEALHVAVGIKIGKCETIQDSRNVSTWKQFDI